MNNKFKADHSCIRAIARKRPLTTDRQTNTLDWSLVMGVVPLFCSAVRAQTDGQTDATDASWSIKTTTCYIQNHFPFP